MKNCIFCLITAAIVLAACETPPNYDELGSELVVSTSLDRYADFKEYETFYISDTIVNLGGTDADTIWVGEDAQQIVNRIKDNLVQRGYTYTSRDSNPDLGIAVGVVKVLNVEFYSGWYAGYPGWFPFWDYYPFYYPWTTYYTYDTGSVIVDAYDVKNADANGQYRVIWNSISFGALGYDSSANMSRALNSINQAFIQSPYLLAD